MKKLFILFITGILLAACGDSGSDNTQQEDEPVFTDEDIALAEEMIEFVQDKEREFVEEANKELDETRDSYEEYETMTEGFTANKEIREEFQDLSNDMILEPFVENYGQHIIQREDRENLNFRVNVKNYDENGESVSLEDFQIVPSYENLDLEEPVMEYHDQYDVHELIFPVNEENTTLFITDSSSNTTVYDKFTFYKTKEGELLVGKMSRLQYNVMISDFEDPEDVQEDLQELPPLQ